MLTIDARCSGRGLEDRHTHYELSVFAPVYEDGVMRGRETVIVSIPEYVRKKFAEKFGSDISESRIRIKADVYRNDQRVREARLPWQAPWQLVTIVKTLDQISPDLEK